MWWRRCVSPDCGSADNVGSRKAWWERRLSRLERVTLFCCTAISSVAVAEVRAFYQPCAAHPPHSHIQLQWGQPSNGFLALPSFFEQPILNSPYDPPRRHWELDWEMELCRLLESHPNVLAYVANQGLGFAVPYRMGGEARTYIPDFIVRVDDGHGADDPLNLVVEVKGYRREDAKAKKQTMENYWVPERQAFDRCARLSATRWRLACAVRAGSWQRATRSP